MISSEEKAIAMQIAGDSKSQADFILERKRVTSSGPPVGGREAALWLADCRDVFGQLKYLTITGFGTGETNQVMIEMSGSINHGTEEFPYVRADFETLWLDDLAKGLKAICCSHLSGVNFTFLFMCKNSSGEYITGRFQGKMIR